MKTMKNTLKMDLYTYIDYGMIKMVCTDPTIYVNITAGTKKLLHDLCLAMCKNQNFRYKIYDNALQPFDDIRNKGLVIKENNEDR